MTVQTRQPSRITALAIGTFFFVNGATYASWVPRLPEIKRTLDVSDTALGLTLVGSGTGGLLVSLTSGWLVNRIGSRAATVTTSVALSLLLPTIALAPVAPVLFVALIAIGAFDGLTDVAMNTQALQLQRSVTQSIVSRMHATWSIGTLAGGLVAGRAAAGHVSLDVQLAITSVTLIVVTALAAPLLLPRDPAPDLVRDEAGRQIRAPRPLLFLLFIVGGLAIVAELPVIEWASLLMEERFDLSPGTASFGFVGFSAGMVIGRLGGDAVADRLGVERSRRLGGVIAAVGVAITCVSPLAPLTVIGLVVTGVGASSLFPMGIRRASDLVVGATGVAMFSSGARLGILIGSPLMGLISDAVSRTIALLVIGGTSAVASALVALPAARDRGGPPPAVTPPH